eukprot:CAMPEP_0196579044 /NCGR_PEP_ID=MMETSP1081-20130531/16471_1 /TAXON_ID=36882 /ORGANISM="Pyramimonas amylifera, Strain CCMP720" /LENGTH=160 /DNA_ID=CAMNT_0041898479 /DNA_START=112 /DNA_END=594 /DNA_ORIENTATION=-
MALRQVLSQAAVALRVQHNPYSHLVLRSLSRPYSTPVPTDRVYAESHEWCKTVDGVATIGISDFAQSELGDVVFVDLPEVGADVAKKETFGVVESVKAASDVYSPVSGEVLEVNTELTSTPSLVNSSAFEDGWMMKVKLSDPSELDSLLDGTAYAKSIEA